MTRQIFLKLLSLIPVLFLVSIILFTLINLLPGDAAIAIVGDAGTMEDIERIREELGYNRPLHERYLSWIGNVLKGDFGHSLITKESVKTKMLDRLPVTMELALLAVIFATLISIPCGVLSAVKRNSLWDNVNSVVAMVGVSMPSFWMGILLILLFSLKLRWIPASGFVRFAVDPLGNLRSMVLPAFCIGFAYSASLMRQTRSALIEVLNQEYILSARAKGLKERVVIWKHALRNAVIPVITVLSMQLGRLIGGSVVVETVFVLPGMGKALVDGITSRDYPIVMAFVLVTATAIVLVNTLVDVLYIVIDPRLSHGKKR